MTHPKKPSEAVRSKDMELLHVTAEALNQARREGWEAANHETRKMILDDAYAITFQTMGQYRTQMAKNVANLKYPEA